jgi:outer membrane protein OmpA-like peptidoglycan-associated protein
MKMKSFFVALLALVSLNVMAQASYEDAEGNKYEFKKHAFITLQGGAQYTLGEAKFDKLLSPNVQLGLGYQFSPIFGARIQANAWQSKGGWNGHRTQIGNTPFTADYKWKYVAPGIDLMFNLSNLFCGWNPNRVFNVTAFIGGGANIAFSNDEVNDIAAVVQQLDAYNLEYLWDGTKVRPFGRAGLDLGFRLSDAVSLIIEGNANILSDHYNSKQADNPDWYFNALAGLKINLGKSYEKIVPVIPVVEPVVEPEPEPIVEPEPEPVIEPLRRDVFFLINSWVIDDVQSAKIREIADYMAKYPEAKVTVDGYADAGTGNDQINDRLAAQRADAVVKVLKEQYGISADRITYDSHGSRVQPFAENDMNSVSICIASPK